MRIGLGTGLKIGLGPAVGLGLGLKLGLGVRPGLGLGLELIITLIVIIRGQNEQNRPIHR